MLTMFVWSKEYSVGVEEMDEQHQHFLEIANEVLTLAAKTEVSKMELLEALGKFLNYALYHLETEEEYFKEFECPQLGHLEAHTMFRERFKDLFLKVEQGAADGLKEHAEAAAQFAGRWILQHILVMDKGYTYCFHEHGLH